MSERVPERLRREIEDGLAPVRPLRPPGVRALLVALWALALLLAIALLGRSDAGSTALGMVIVWGGAAAQALAGVALIVLALREAVPGEPMSPATRAGAFAAAFVVQLAVAGMTSLDIVVRHAGASACMTVEWVLALPALVLTLVLVARALPVRPGWAGALAGFGSGLISDAAWHLACPVADMRHLGWHLGAILALAASGALLGLVWRRLCAARLGF